MGTVELELEGLTPEEVTVTVAVDVVVVRTLQEVADLLTAECLAALRALDGIGPRRASRILQVEVDHSESRRSASACRGISSSRTASSNLRFLVRSM